LHDFRAGEFMLKRVFAAVMALILLVGCLYSCGGNTATKGNADYIYEITDDGVILLFYKGAGGAVNIPSEIEGKPVVEIAPECFLRRGNVTSVAIPSSVKVIGSFAFRLCSYLETIVIPSSVEDIGVHAFDDTSWYKNATEEFVIVGDGVLIKYNGTSSVIDIPQNVKAISCALGSEEIDVTDIKIPDGIKYISGNAFVKTSWRLSLTDEFVIVGDGILIKYAGKGGDVIIPDNVKSVSGAFYDSSKVTSVTIPDSVTRIESYSFACTNGFGANTELSRNSILESVSIPDTVNYIGAAAFFNCCNLKEADIPSSVKYIQPQTYIFCDNINNVVIPDNVLSIGFTAFGETFALTKINFGTKLKFIGEAAFYNDKNLTELVLPENFKYAAGTSFAYCTGLTSVYVPKEIDTIVSTAFDGCAKDKLIIKGFAGTETERFAAAASFKFESVKK